MTKLSTIIVTWNGLRYLPTCFAALVPQLPSGSEIVLVDNGSTDGSAAWARDAYPPARVLSLAENLGFAGGVAAGMRVASGEELLLLNDDAFVEPGFVAALTGALARRQDVGAAGAVLTFAHRPELVASAGICVRRDGVALDLWAGRPVGELPVEPVEIFGPSGGAALFRRAMIDDVGLPEPTFFAYLEDVDLAWRARLRGWRSLLVPQARARHVYSATGGQGSPLKQRLLARNRLRVLARCLPAPILARHLAAIAGYDLMAIAYGLASGRTQVAAGRWAALRSLPELLGQRRAIQARRTVPIAALERWLEPAPGPLATLRAQRQLDQLLRGRPGGAS